MTDDVSPDLTLRDRFLAGRCTPEELVRIRTLSEEDPERWHGLEALCEGFNERRQMPAPTWQDAWARWKSAERFSVEQVPVEQVPVGRVPVENRGRSERRPRNWRGAAYTLAGTTLLAIAAVTLRTGSRLGSRLGSRAGASYLSMTASTFATNATQQAAVTLPDGTRVLLSPRTTLHATGIDGRTVTLDSGEAYFDVATHASVPFIVRSGAMTTRVLGTAFLIRRDPHHAHVRVSVTEGKVRVTTALAHREDLTVTAGQIGDLTDSTTRLSALDDLPPGMERKRDEMVFYHTPVASVLGVIGQWYGLQFHCVDSALLRRSVTIGLSTQSSAEVFSVLQDLLDVNVAVHGDTVTLAARSPRPQPSSPRMRNYDIWTPTRENGR